MTLIYTYICTMRSFNEQNTTNQLRNLLKKRSRACVIDIVYRRNCFPTSYFWCGYVYKHMLYLLEITKEAYVSYDTKSTKRNSPLPIKTRSTCVSYANYTKNNTTPKKQIFCKMRTIQSIVCLLPQEQQGLFKHHQ